mmetsp:Transcript_33676/g.106448  ORF Transcript_33676/g.106448 Transcript_33676/m.106448 type:complete len:262 (-) Transcript_33676:1232-2017(-)
MLMASRMRTSISSSSSGTDAPASGSSGSSASSASDAPKGASAIFATNPLDFPRRPSVRLFPTKRGFWPRFSAGPSAGAFSADEKACALAKAHATSKAPLTQSSFSTLSTFSKLLMWRMWLITSTTSSGSGSTPSSVRMPALRRWSGSGVAAKASSPAPPGSMSSLSSTMASCGAGTKDASSSLVTDSASAASASSAARLRLRTSARTSAEALRRISRLLRRSRAFRAAAMPAVKHCRSISDLGLSGSASVFRFWGGFRSRP